MTIPVGADRQNERNKIAAQFYAQVCLEAENIIAQSIIDGTPRVEGAHYAAMRRLLQRRGMLVYGDILIEQMRVQGYGQEVNGEQADT